MNKSLVFRGLGARESRRRNRAATGESPQHGVQGAPAVAYREFLLRADFGQSVAKGRVKKQRVVAESVAAARSLQQAALDGAVECAENPAGTRQGDDADKARGTVLDAAQAFAQQAVVIFVGGVGAGSANSSSVVKRL